MERLREIPGLTTEPATSAQRVRLIEIGEQELAVARVEHTACQTAESRRRPAGGARIHIDSSLGARPRVIRTQVLYACVNAARPSALRAYTFRRRSPGPSGS